MAEITADREYWFVVRGEAMESGKCAQEVFATREEAEQAAAGYDDVLLPIDGLILPEGSIPPEGVEF